MTQDEMLKGMCPGELTAADCRAIVAARGLPPAARDSSELLRHVFLSDTGVAEALAGLERDEVLLLHLLRLVARPVGIEFFGRVYPTEARNVFEATFVQRYRGVFQRVRERLIRRGLLLFGTAPDPWDRKSVLERQEFLFPSEFARFLPPPGPTVRLDAVVRGECCEAMVRRKLAEIVQPETAVAATEPLPGPRLRVHAGELRLGERLLGAGDLDQWRMQACSQACLAKPPPVQQDGVSPLHLAVSVLSGLPEHQWAAPSTLLPLWQLACGTKDLPDPAAVCACAWQWGLLVRTAVHGEVLYRGHTPAETPEIAPDTYLDVGRPEGVAVGLDRVTVTGLVLLSHICVMEVSGGQLLARPSLVRLGRAPDSMLNSPTVLWLRDRHAGFAAVWKQFSTLRDKTLVHQGLLVARVRDLGLRVELERAFPQGSRFVTLADEWVAFPRGLLPEVERVVAQAGHVLKTVNADG